MQTVFSYIYIIYMVLPQDEICYFHQKPDLYDLVTSKKFYRAKAKLDLGGQSFITRIEMKIPYIILHYVFIISIYTYIYIYTYVFLTRFLREKKHQEKEKRT